MFDIKVGLKGAIEEHQARAQAVTKCRAMCGRAMKNGQSFTPGWVCTAVRTCAYQVGAKSREVSRQIIAIACSIILRTRPG
jgi:hypothetical protein